jgi:hypothetical protein
VPTTAENFLTVGGALLVAVGMRRQRFTDRTRTVSGACVRGSLLLAAIDLACMLVRAATLDKSSRSDVRQHWYRAIEGRLDVLEAAGGTVGRCQPVRLRRLICSEGAPSSLLTRPAVAYGLPPTPSETLRLSRAAPHHDGTLGVHFALSTLDRSERSMRKSPVTEEQSTSSPSCRSHVVSPVLHASDPDG